MTEPTSRPLPAPSSVQASAPESAPESDPVSAPMSAQPSARTPTRTSATATPGKPLSLAGLDHVVIAVTDLDRAASEWAAQGFTLSPRGVHSAHMGTINHTLMLGPDYLELLAVAQATDANRATRGFLERRGEGIERVAMRSLDAGADADALRARGIAATGPVDFSRPVTLADGSQTEASFSVFYWPDDARIADMRLFACQHHTPAAVWVPALQRHPNGATRILRIEQYVNDPTSDANRLGGLLGLRPRPLAPTACLGGGWRIVTAAGRACLDFREAGQHAVRARLVLASTSAETIARPSWLGNGISVVFEADPDVG